VDDTVIKIGGGLVVAALSGVTFVAYKHPRAYAKVFLILIAVCTTIFLGEIVWGMSNVAARTAAFEAMKLSGSDELANADKIYAAVAAHSTPDWVLGVTIAIWAYLVFLSSFPYWLLDQETPQNKNK
jgi:TRAP-type C4-dicarboxylate transport system permease small subunit